jgi:RNA polymerase sigma-70 factor, ECF subfamily
MEIAQTGMAVAARASGPGLEQIFVAQKDLIFRAAYRITGSASDAEDVLQTVFLRLARQPKLPEIANLQGYLHRSAVNASLDLLRSRKDSITSSIDDDSKPAAAIAKDTAGQVTEIRDWLRQALSRLNPRWAEMFVLRFVEEMSNREIARVMNTSAAVVAVVLHRTRALLKKDYMAVTRGTR